MAEQDDQLIAQMAAQQLGAPAPEQPAPQQAPAADPAKQDAPPTQMENAQEAVSPSTEGDKAKEESFIEVDFGDGRKETMSASQIAGMASRYKDLNHKNATRYKPLEPAINMIDNMVAQARANGAEVGGDDVAQFLQAAVQAYAKNPQMGGQQDPTPDRPDGAQYDAQLDAQIKQWEKENAVTLPPLYRDGVKVMRSLMEDNQALKNEMANLINQARQVNQAAAGQVQQVNETGEQVYRQQAANNLNEAQQRFNLPDEMEDDFFNFAYGRGYTIEDFIDRELTMNVMNDFANNRDAPEMERLRALNAKRQAFTGAVQSAPSGGAPTGQPNVDQQFMDAVTAKAMQKRGLA